MIGRDALFRDIFDLLAHGLVLTDGDGTIAHANASAAAALGLTVDEVSGRTASDPRWSVVDEHGLLLGPAERPSAVAQREGRPVTGVVVGVDRPDGARAWFEVHSWPLVPGDSASPVVTELADVTAHRGASEHVRLQARLLDMVGQAVIATDLDGSIAYWNPAAQVMMGWAPDEVVGRDIAEVTPAPHERDHAHQVMARLRRGESWRGEIELRRRDGSTFTAAVTNAPWHDQRGTLVGIIGVSMDLSDRIRIELQAVRRAEAQAVVARLGQEALQTTDVDAFLVEAVRTTAALLDYDLAAVVDVREGGGYVRFRAAVGWDEDWVGRSLPVEPGSQLEAALRDGETALVEDVADEPDGTLEAAAERAGMHAGACVPLSTRDEVVGCLLVHRRAAGPLEPEAVTVLQSVANILAAALERDRADAELQRLALHDPLTSLPNRTLVTDRIAHALARRERQGGDVALLFADLDGFKEVNDTFGHAAGDRLLAAVARRMDSVVRASDTVARLAGDEFAVLCEDLLGPADAVILADRLGRAVAAPFEVDGRQVTVSASLGVAMAADGDTPDTLLGHADAAMYEAKERGRDRFVIYDEALADTTAMRLHLAEQLRDAVDAAALSLRYQPVHDLATGRVVAVEALLRWQRGPDDLVAPDAFLDVAEETGAIVRLGAWALLEACRTAAAWADVAVSVNLSPRQLVTPGFVDEVDGVLAATGLPAHRLWLEIAERSAAGSRGTAPLAALAERGISLVVDDFGAGPAALAVLRVAPFRAVKLDRCIVSGRKGPGAGDGLADPALAAATVAAARTLGLRVVAEGVETASQLAALRSLGCDFGQGYYWAAPMPAAALGGLVDGSG